MAFLSVGRSRTSGPRWKRTAVSDSTAWLRTSQTKTADAWTASAVSSGGMSDVALIEHIVQVASVNAQITEVFLFHF